MSLAVRLVRALFVFGVIFLSYMVQLGLARGLRRSGRDPRTGREVLEWPAWVKARRRRVDAKNAKRLLRAMLQLRGVYIKLGQVLSIMGGFLPRVYTSELESLQDAVPPHPFSDVERTIRRSLGKHPDLLFDRFEREPIAAASLGQVHVAYLKDGEKVAVKVLYPHIRDVVAVDMRVLRLAMYVYEWFFPFRNIERVHSSLVDLLRRETDYVHEAECIEAIGKNFADEADILVPGVVHELTTPDVLTMTFMEGIKITRFDEYERLGIDRTKVATRLIQSFYKQLFVNRLFHADPHPGNFLVQDGENGTEPKLVILDFGAISEARDSLMEGLVDMLQALFTQDKALAVKGFRRMGFVAEDGNQELLERTVVTYFQKLLKVQDRTAGALMRAKQSDLEKLADPELERQELRELMRSFDYPEGWFYVERACVMMFWLCGQIAPDMDTMQVGFPYVMPLLMKRQAELAAEREREEAAARAALAAGGPPATEDGPPAHGEDASPGRTPDAAAVGEPVEAEAEVEVAAPPPASAAS